MKILKFGLGFIWLIGLSGCAGSGLSTSEWFTHAQLSYVNISKGDILLKEGIKKKELGDYEGAFRKWEEAAHFYRDQGEEKKLVQVYYLFGSSYLDINHYDECLKYFRQSQTLSEKMKYPDGILLAFIGLAGAYSKLGDPNQAVDYYNQALKIARQAGDSKNQVKILDGLGTIYLRQKQPDLSLARYQEALSIAQKASYKEGVQSSFNGIGLTLTGRGKYHEAMGYFQQALSIAKERNDIPTIFDTLSYIGTCHVLLGDYSRGLSSFQEGMSMAAAMDLSFPEKKLQAYYGIASIHARKGEILRAARNYKSAIAQIETTRSRLASEEHRSGFLENKIAIYEDLIDLLLRNDNLPPTRHSTDDPITAEFREYGESRAEIAFYYAESTKGRSFLESMAKGKQTFITERIPKEIADQEKKLAGTLAALEAGSVQKEEGKRGGGSRKKEIEQVKRELEEFINRLKKDYPDYAAIKYPEPVTLRDIPLKDNEVLLEFKVNPKDTYLWVVGRGTEPRLIPIPLGREELAQKIRDFREPVEQVHKLDNFDPQKGEKLFQILLEKGLGGVDKKKNIIIVPDGPLNLLPFEALTIDSSRRIKKTDPSGGASNWGEIRFLGEDYKISYYPSTSIMAVLRKAKTPAVPPKTLFALGDPIYEESDSRYREHRTGKDGAPSLQAASRSTPEKISLREVVLRSGFSIPRLPETREEVLKIGELFSSKEGGASIKLDLQARESEVKKARLSDYQYIHFATHGILSGDIPYILEPALVLTQVAESEEDGFLKTSEVLGWKLKADLVVLSACKTALGKQVAGEGIVGLSRAFMLAGAKSVVVSLWSVDSNSTAALMRQYYKNLRAGQTKEESLRLAKQELKAGIYSVHRGRGLQIVSAEEPIRLNAQHPFFWAPFILLGEWE